jgi:hypothetical protein
MRRYCAPVQHPAAAQNIGMVAILVRHMDARCGQRDAGACSPYSVYCCRELLDELEIGVDVVTPASSAACTCGRLRHSAVSSAIPPRTPAAIPHNRDVALSGAPAGSVAVDLDRPFHVDGRFRALARKQLHRRRRMLFSSRMGTITSPSRCDSIASSWNTVPPRRPNCSSSSAASIGRFCAVSSASSESTRTVTPFCVSVHQVVSFSPAQP